MSRPLPYVVFRVDASAAIGSGHLVRCLNLADALSARGATAHFVMRAHPGHFAGLVETRGYRCSLLRSPGLQDRTDKSWAHSHWLGVATAVDAKETIATLSGRPDWVVCDHYGIDAAWHELLRGHTERILVIDDLADRPHDCDILIDQNALPSLGRDYSGLVPLASRNLLGADYALMAGEYGRLRPFLPPRRGALGRVLVFFGGADSHNLTGTAVEAIGLLEADDVMFDVVAGAAHPKRAQLAAAIKHLPNAKLHGALPSLAPLIAQADLAVGAGGVTMWERCALGLPSLVVTVAENQLEGTRAAEEAGLVRHIGNWNDITPNAIASALRDAIRAGCDERMSRSCANFVDGLGARRAALAMLGPGPLDIRVRRARPDDELRLLRWANDPETRHQAFQPDIIRPDSHSRWFNARLRSVSTCRIFIGEVWHNVPAGQVRFDRLDGDEWLISYSVDLALRGWGLGRPLLEAAMEELRSEFPDCSFRALVKDGNPASKRIFLTAGFVPVASESLGSSAFILASR